MASPAVTPDAARTSRTLAKDVGELAREVRRMPSILVDPPHADAVDHWGGETIEQLLADSDALTGPNPRCIDEIAPAPTAEQYKAMHRLLAKIPPPTEVISLPFHPNALRDRLLSPPEILPPPTVPEIEIPVAGAVKIRPARVKRAPKPKKGKGGKS